MSLNNPEKSKAPPRPPAPKITPIKKKGVLGVGSEFSIHFGRQSFDSLYEDDELNVSKSIIEFRKSESDYGLDSKRKSDRIVAQTDPLLKTTFNAESTSSSPDASPKRIASDNIKSSLVREIPHTPVKANTHLPQPEVDKVVDSKEDKIDEESGKKKVPPRPKSEPVSSTGKLQTIPSQTGNGFNQVRGFVKPPEEMLTSDSRDSDWSNSGSYEESGLDPLTLMSMQHEKEAIDLIDEDCGENVDKTDHSRKDDSNKSHLMEESKSRSSSIRIVDNFYEPVDENDSCVASLFNKKTAAGVDQSNVVAMGTTTTSPPRPSGLVKQLKHRKAKQVPDKTSPMSFKSLTSEKDDDEDFESIEEESDDGLESMSTDTKSTSMKNNSFSNRLVKRLTEGHIVIESASPVPVKQLSITTIVVFFYYILPIPSYISGFIMGAVVSVLLLRFHAWFTEAPPPRPPVLHPKLEELPDFFIPEMKDSKSEPGVFKGWLNELPHEYEADNYHINQTHSVFATLEGTSLRLQQPKVNVPKRAMWDEDTIHSSQFIAQRHLDLQGSKVFLKPEGLVKKRVWSKKYPICIILKDKGAEKLAKKSSSNSLASTSREGSVEDDYQGFEVVDSAQKGYIYLLARTGREKEEWFRRFEAASAGRPLCSNITELKRLAEFKPRPKKNENGLLKKHQRQDSNGSISSISSSEEMEDLHEDFLVDYMRYMGRIMPQDTSSPGTPKKEVTTGDRIVCDCSVLWTNALLSRGLWDFLRDLHWSDKMKDKIQKKLDKIHVPYFMDALTITHLNLGETIPTIRRASRPYIDERGLWIEFDIVYNGGLKMVMETKMNLMKLKNKKKPKELKEGKTFETEKRSAITNSDEEDSAESSTDDEQEVVDGPEEPNQAPTPQSTSSGAGKRILKFLDKITETKYFQKATEYKYIKKAMKSVSNTQLMLTVEVKNLSGCLVVNIPPPPTDRVWYGFRSNPRLWLSATPRVGEREVSYHHVTEWIEKKLSVEFQKVFVLPNMDDIVLPVMVSRLPGDQVPEKKYSDKL